jgi:hypothetical protein
VHSIVEQESELNKIGFFVIAVRIIKKLFRYKNPDVQMNQLSKELFPPHLDSNGKNDQQVDPVSRLGGQPANLEKSITKLEPLKILDIPTYLVRL